MFTADAMSGHVDVKFDFPSRNLELRGRLLRFFFFPSRSYEF